MKTNEQKERKRETTKLRNKRKKTELRNKEWKVVIFETDKDNLRWCSDIENIVKNNHLIPFIIRKYNAENVSDFLGINLEEHEQNNWRISVFYQDEMPDEYELYKKNKYIKQED